MSASGDGMLTAKREFGAALWICGGLSSTIDCRSFGDAMCLCRFQRYGTSHPAF
jgi:hypothetical protein